MELLVNGVVCVWLSAEDNVPRLSQIFDAYAKILRRPSFLQENGITDRAAAAKFIYKVGALPCLSATPSKPFWSVCCFSHGPVELH